MIEEKTADIGELVLPLIDYSDPDAVARQSIAPNAACEIDGEFADVRNLMHLVRELKKDLEYMTRSRNGWQSSAMLMRNVALRDRIEREPVVKPVAPVDVYKVLKKWADGGSLDVLHISAISRDVATALASAPERMDAEPVAWQRRYSYPSNGEVPRWEQCERIEAIDPFSRKPAYDYRPLYASPPAPVVTDEMVAKAGKAADDALWRWRGLGDRAQGQGLDGMHAIIRAALKAALASREAT